MNIYNGEHELDYLSINGAVKKQVYTYFLYESNNGIQKESPAYCVNPTTPGVPQTVGPGESIKYLADETASDPKVVGIISNGYPHRSLGELNLDSPAPSWTLATASWPPPRIFTSGALPITICSPPA